MCSTFPWWRSPRGLMSDYIVFKHEVASRAISYYLIASYIHTIQHALPSWPLVNSGGYIVLYLYNTCNHTLINVKNPVAQSSICGLALWPSLTGLDYDIWSFSVLQTNSTSLVSLGLLTLVPDRGITSSGYRQDIGLRSSICLLFVITLITAPRIWPSLLAITLPNFHKQRGEFSSWTMTTSPTIGEWETPICLTVWLLSEFKEIVISPLYPILI